MNPWIRKADQPDDRPPRRKPKDYLPDLPDRQRDPNKPDLWVIAERIRAKVLPEAWEELPTDLSIYVDHYLYGVPKEDIR